MNPHFLLLQLKRIGDLILTTPALLRLRELHPSARITLAIDSASADLAPALPAVDEVLTLNRRSPLAGPLALLRRRPFHACLDFTGGTDRSALLAALSGAPWKATWARPGKLSWWKNHLYRELSLASVQRLHTVDYHLALADPHYATRPAPPVTLHLPPAAQAAAAQILARTLPDPGAPFLIVHPGSARPEKMWPPEHWAEIIRWSLDHHPRFTCLITGGPDPSEKSAAASLAALVARPARCHDLCGLTRLPILAALIARSRLLLGVDSAAIHLAGALRIPHLALYGPTNPFHWRSRTPSARIILASQPDHPLRGDDDPAFTPRHTPAPLTQITPAQALAALSETKNFPWNPETPPSPA